MTTANERWSTRNADGTLRWSWHIIENYLTCPRKYKLAVLDDVIATDYKPPLALGTAVHRGLAAGFRRLQRAQKRMGGAFSVDVRGRALIESTAIAAVNADEGVNTADRIMAERLVRSYCQGGNSESEAGVIDFSLWEVLNVEEIVYADLQQITHGSHHIYWSQTPDLVVRISSGYHQGIWVVDHKTTSRMGKMSLAKYYIDGQAQALVVTLRAAGVNVKGFVANLIVKTKIVQFAQDYIDFDMDQSAEFATEMWGWQQTIRSKIRHKGPWPRNYHACLGQYGYCDYYELCRTGDYVNAASVDGFAPRGQVVIGAAARDIDTPWILEA